MTIPDQMSFLESWQQTVVLNNSVVCGEIGLQLPTRYFPLNALSGTLLQNRVFFLKFTPLSVFVLSMDGTITHTAI